MQGGGGEKIISTWWIYDGIQDLPAKHIREEVQEVCKYGFSFKTDSTQWHKLTLNKHTTKSALDEPHKIDKHFIKELQSGHIYCDNQFQARVHIPFFIKEQRNKYRVINDYSATVNGLSINSITPKHVATVELPTTTNLVQFLDAKNNRFPRTFD